MNKLQKITMKRICNDIKSVKRDPIPYIDAYCEKKDLLKWYFLIEGPADSDYHGGYYLGLLLHHKDYPFQPPDFIMLTPNGKFEINRKICISITGFHKDEWSTTWNLISIMNGFLSIMCDDKEGGIGHILRSTEERQYLAKQSITYNQKNHPEIFNKFLKRNRFAKLKKSLL